MNEEQNKESPPSTDDNQQQEPPLSNPATDEPIASSETTTEAEPLPRETEASGRAGTRNEHPSPSNRYGIIMPIIRQHLITRKAGKVISGNF